MLLLSIAARNSLIWVETDLQATPVGCDPVPMNYQRSPGVCLTLLTREHVRIDACDANRFSRFVRRRHIRIYCSTL